MKFGFHSALPEEDEEVTAVVRVAIASCGAELGLPAHSR
jgi:hypothetical protein